MTCLYDLIVAKMVGKHFGCIDYLISDVGQCLSHDSLRVTVAIILSRVEGGYSLVEARS